jgi:hypothetical protein
VGSSCGVEAETFGYSSIVRPIERRASFDRPQAGGYNIRKIASGNSRTTNAAETAFWQLADLRLTDRYISINVVTAYGVSLTTRYFAVLGMPLVKTVTKAGPDGKSVTGREMKVVLDQARTGAARRKATWLFSRLRNCTIG